MKRLLPLWMFLAAWIPTLLTLLFLPRRRGVRCRRTAQNTLKTIE